MIGSRWFTEKLLSKFVQQHQNRKYYRGRRKGCRVRAASTWTGGRTCRRRRRSSSTRASSTGATNTSGLSKNETRWAAQDGKVAEKWTPDLTGPSSDPTCSLPLLPKSLKWLEFSALLVDCKTKFQLGLSLYLRLRESSLSQMSCDVVLNQRWSLYLGERSFIKPGRLRFITRWLPQ